MISGHLGSFDTDSVHEGKKARVHSCDGINSGDMAVLRVVSPAVVIVISSPPGGSSVRPSCFHFPLVVTLMGLRYLVVVTAAGPWGHHGVMVLTVAIWLC